MSILKSHTPHSKPNVSDDSGSRLFHLVTQASFFLAIIMASVFYLERNMGDAGWDIWCMINSERFCPAHQRWILILVQALPLAALKAGLGIKSVLFLHAIGPTLLFYGAFLYVSLRLKDRMSSLAILVAYSLFIAEIYFIWPHLEMQLIIPLLIIFKSLIFTDKVGKVESYTLIAILSLLIVTGHPTGMLPLSFIIAWYTFAKRKINYFIVLIFILSITFNMYNIDIYEQGMGKQLNFNLFTHLIQENTIWNRLLSLFRNNLLLWLITVISIVWLIRKNNMMIAGLTVLFAVGYLLMDMALVSFEQQEPYLVPFGGMIILLFMDTVISDLKPPSKAPLVALVLFLWGMLLIYRERAPFTAKLDMLNVLISEAESKYGTNFIVGDDYFFRDQRVSRSGFWHAESMIISSLEDPTASRAIVPVSYLLREFDQITNYLDHEKLNEHFLSGFADLNDSILLSYANIYFKEEYKSQEIFKMYFYQAMNRSFFDPASDSFYRLDEPSNQLRKLK
ncbi:MAG: hypothetical protein GY751_15610 [Bacteroidetes bacterium]|nr:hypothetical protein [Bacteroidota bacterium]